MKKVTVIGGDKRLKVVENHLRNSGFDVDTLGLYENDNGNPSDSNTIVLPVPTTRDGLTVFTPLTNKVIPLAEIVEKTDSSQLILTCNYNFENKNCVNYGTLDSYSLLNAVPTAEGAIKIAIESTEYTLWQSNVLVIGYGRVGKILADRLKALGCNVTVSARKSVDFAMLDALGFKHIETDRLNSSVLDYDIIFNTVDVKVIDQLSLKRCKSDLILDLSSKGGLDLSVARQYGINAVKAPGLPGAIAPRTAGKILAKTVLELINSHI